MGYSRFNNRAKSFRKLFNPKKKSDKQMKRFQKPRVPRVSFAKRVNALISKQQENKTSATFNASNPIVVSNGVSNSWNFFVHNKLNLLPYWQIQPGTTSQNRIGNTIKLKRWIIKGLIGPQNLSFQNNEGTYLHNTFQGYVTIYLGRLKDNSDVSATLPHFYQNGSTSFAPSGRATDILAPVNKEIYKIYTKRRMKMGQSYGTNAGNEMLPNNDFAVSRTFGFDVCKYIMKNAKINFLDNDSQPIHPVLRTLALWATWTPSTQVLGVSPPNTSSQSLYRIELVSHFEYEDA